MPVRGFLCLIWRETHTKGLRAGFPTRLEEDEGRKAPGQNREVDRTHQSKEVGGGEADGRERQLLEPVDSGRVGQREKMSLLFVALWVVCP